MFDYVAQDQHTCLKPSGFFCNSFTRLAGLLQRSGARFTNVLSAKKFVSSFLRTVCVSQTPSTYEFLKDFAKIFLNIVVTLRQGGGDLSFRKFRKYGRLHLSQPAYRTKFAYYSVKTYYLSTKLSEGIYFR